MMSNITNALAPYAPWLLVIFIKGTVLLLTAGAATQLLRKASAALRHFLYAAAMTTLLVLSLRLHALIRRAVPVDAIMLGSRLRWLCRDLGIRREVVLLGSDEIDVPITAGILDPKIILSPQSAAWSETRRNAVLCHELAHVKRLDALTQLIAAIVCALYWLNPLVWLAVRAMRAERERACDDYVLARGTSASEYAHELLEIVTMLRRPQPTAALAMARRSQLEGRVLA